jgi:hypothetical protein
MISMAPLKWLSSKARTYLLLTRPELELTWTGQKGKDGGRDIGDRPRRLVAAQRPSACFAPTIAD